MPGKRSTTVPVKVIRKVHHVPDFYRGVTTKRHDWPKTYGNGSSGELARKPAQPTRSNS